MTPTFLFTYFIQHNPLQESIDCNESIHNIVLYLMLYLIFDVPVSVIYMDQINSRQHYINNHCKSTTFSELVLCYKITMNNAVDLSSTLPFFHDYTKIIIETETIIFFSFSHILFTDEFFMFVLNNFS